MKLRPYQLQALDAMAHRQITVLPTGTGKTRIMAEHCARALRRSEPSLIVVHREELVPQTQEALRQAEVPAAKVGLVQAGERRFGGVTIAMQQTLRGHLEEMPSFRHLIVDEAHRYTTVKSGHAILDAAEKKGARIYGFTATPQVNMKPIYGPGKPFVGVSFKRTIPWAVVNGYLSDVRAKTVKLGADLGKVKLDKGTGDFAAGSLSDALLRVRAPERIVEAWMREAEGRLRSIAFCPTVEFGGKLAEEMRKKTDRVVEVYGTTPAAERRERIEAFRRGEALVLINVIVGAEGFDVPEVDCVLMARPTKSWTLYTQCVGRGLRPAPGKTDCLVLDFAGTAGVHDLASLPKIVGAPKLETGKSLRKLVEERSPKELDIDFGVAEMEETLLYAPIAWTQLGEEFVAVFDSGSVVAIAPVEDEATGTVQYGAFLVNLRDGKELEIGLYDFPGEASEVAEDFIRDEGEGSLSRRRAPWRMGKPTPAQAKWFKAGQVPATRGEASDRITVLLYRQARMKGA